MKKATRVATAMEVLTYPESPWRKDAEGRAEMTLANRDGAEIPRVKGAGSTMTVDGKKVQLMHNGLKVLQDGYQGPWQTKVIKGLRGIHEPQEEKVFYEVLKRVKSGGVMVELGSWWSYYSMWFLSAIKNSKVYCCEPDPDNLKLGEANAKLNDFKVGEQINFRQYAAGYKDGKSVKLSDANGDFFTAPIKSIDKLLTDEGVKKLEILHFDIQGAELDALKGAEKSIEAGKIRFIFISTHHYSISGDPMIHQKCVDFIKARGGHIITQHTVLESCSGDGLVVASFDKNDADLTVHVTPQPSDDTLFRIAEADLDILWKSHDSLYEEVHELGDYARSLQAQLMEKQAMIDDLAQQLANKRPLARRLGSAFKRRMKRSRE